MFNSFYLNKRLYIVLAVIVVTFIIAFSFPMFFIVGKVFLVVYLLTIVAEFFYLNKCSKYIDVSREVEEKLSLGDKQHVIYTLENKNQVALHIEVHDELPFQFQQRAFIADFKIDKNKVITQNFTIQPFERGQYAFGHINVFLRLPIPGLISYKKVISKPQNSKVYPSIIQMRKYALQVFSKTASLIGIRKTRRIGESNEFEHIRPYQQGDNIKTINWKATSRERELMVNQFQDTKSQRVYCIVDKGRSMKMPFYNMTLLDHAINSTLIISNIILKKYDKVGLITFSDKIGSLIKAKSLSGQLEHISHHLYRQKTDFKESNFQKLYYILRKQLNQRSILLLYTNFEHEIDLERNLKFLKLISQKHLLLIIFFIDTELESFADKQPTTLKDIYDITFAKQSLISKQKVAYKLKINGIQSILTKPEDLNINVINKYLEIKSKQMQ